MNKSNYVATKVINTMDYSFSKNVRKRIARPSLIDGVLFETIRDAARANGICDSYMSKCRQKGEMPNGTPIKRLTRDEYEALL